ncbi:hypothetical protein WME97_17230 [Sorangium sp. So ce367]|uniref:hypothetical protein n=1 Tax=Sorangium sp. So ce367 TaxID=3133305 RepID=UPI003F5FE369
MKPRLALVASTSALALAGCAAEATPVPVEALAQSGRSAFVCLAIDRPDPNKPGVMRSLPITDCSYGTVESSTDYEVDAKDGGRATLPHLYGLVTQTAHGEVAVVDLTTESSLIVDRDTGTPAPSFLPVGAQPVDIVATPGGTASFVAVAEPGRAGIYALPSAKVLPREGCPVPSLSSWPACSLPSAPGEMLLVADPPDPDADPEGSAKLRSSCEGRYDVEPTEPGDPGAFVDDVCSTSNGSLDMEGGGRQKLLVTLPDLGGFVVIDAQKLLEDTAYQDGGFAACDVERWVPLQVSLPPAEPPDEPPPGDVPPGDVSCAQPAVAASPEQAFDKARPAGLALSGDRLFIADLDAPVIHVVDLPTPCEPREQPPLLPASTLEPGRVVTTRRLAVSQASPPEFNRYLYAVDAGDGSVMVFDISDDVSEDPSRRSPLSRENPDWNPFQPPDRIRLPAPVRDLAIVQREIPRSLPATGVVPRGIRCSPLPELRTCDSSVTSCDLETLYRTSSDRDSGAGPLKLRGTFAYMALTNGQVAIVDIDDLDAACRGPERQSVRAGCDADASPSSPLLETSGEASCNVVLPHAVRSETYIVASDGSGQIEPGVQGLPILYDRSGAVVPLSGESPKMRATFPSEGAAPDLALAVGVQREVIASSDSAESELDERGLVLRSGGPQHALTMNLEDPRVHIANETWAVTYEGVLTSITRASVAFDENLDLRGTDARFCRRGVQSLTSVKAQLKAAGVPEGEAETRAEQLADVAQITSELPDEDATYWKSVDSAVCSFDTCNAKYGSVITSRPALRIVEAYEDHLELDRTDEVGFAACCFAGSVQLDIRAGGQWIVRSNGAGFLHHVIADPAGGYCRNSCDTRLSRFNGRVAHTPRDGRVTDGDVGAFLNPMFRFAVTGGVPEQDMQFRFTTQGAFTPLALDLVDISDTSELQPQSIQLVPATGQLAVTDGSVQGLFLLSSRDVAVTRRYR